MPSVKVPAVVTEELFRIGEKGVSLFTLAYMLLTFVGMLTISWVLRLGLRRALRRGKMEAAGGDQGVADRLIHYGFILVGIALALQSAGCLRSASASRCRTSRRTSFPASSC
jgi:small-conductance mechanosensitive channel